MKKLNLADNGFLQVESRETPMHVGVLQIFKIPNGVDRVEFFDEILESIGKVTATTAPFNQRLHHPTIKVGLPSWKTDDDFELDYHIRHSALPQPGTTDHLLTLISRLHANLLDRTRPLWEFYLIEGLDNDQFALYFKVHHACMDGVGGMNMMKAILSESQDAHAAKPLGKEKKRKSKQDLSFKEQMDRSFSKFKKQVTTLSELTNIFVNVGKKALQSEDPAAPVWYTAPKSLLNVPITAHRRFVVKSFSLDEFKKVGKAHGVTLNDIVLAVCAGALRRYLKDQNAVPEKGLHAGVPVSIRPKDGSSSGNAISNLVCNLGTHIEDPIERLKHINFSTLAAKEKLSSMSREAIQSYTMIAMSPFILSQAFNAAKKAPLPYNLVISNVPGSKKPLYLNGAEMEHFYAVSLIFEMQALNITITSYVDSLDFGLIACRTAVPHLQNLADYLVDAFEELKK